MLAHTECGIQLRFVEAEGTRELLASNDSSRVRQPKSRKASHGAPCVDTAKNRTLNAGMAS
jgi:hypothetical protein